MTQLKAAKEKNLKESIKSAKSVNSKKIWSKSLTKDFLTDYAEGLACSNFDRKKFYVNRRVSTNKWYVCQSSIIDDDNELEDDTEPPIVTNFKRIRVVTIDNANVMKCSCCYYNIWLMPSVHMCSIINDFNYYTPELFHIRWWKHYHFFYKRETDSNNNKDIVKNMKNSLFRIRTNHFCHETGIYIGVPLTGTSFLLSLDNEYDFDVDGCNDKTYQIMHAIVKMEELRKPLINGSKAYRQYMPTQMSKYMNSIDSNNDNFEDNAAQLLLCDDNSQLLPHHNNIVNGMGAVSQMLSQLSDYREDCAKIPNLRNSSCNEDSLQVYDKLKPMFHSLMNNIKNEKQLLEAMDAFEKLTFKFSNDTNKKRKACDDEDDITFLGEVNGPRVKES